MEFEHVNSLSEIQNELKKVFKIVKIKRSILPFFLEKKTQTIITNTDLVDIQKHGINLSNPKNKDFHLQRPCKN